MHSSDPHRCSFYAGGEQCQKAWTRWALVLGKNRPVCDAHAEVQSVPEGARLLWDFKIMAMQQEYDRTGDEELAQRLVGIRVRAEEKDRARALAAYKRAVDHDRTHEDALLAVWRTARYAEGDPRRGDV